MSKLLWLPTALLLLCCTAGSTPDPSSPQLLNANTSRAAAARALRTLKSTVNKENATRYGFRDPQEAQAATLVELRLVNKRLDTRRLMLDVPNESALVKEDKIETWAYETRSGAVGQILVREANGSWAPMSIGSTRAMKELRATLALIRASGGRSTAIVRTHALPKTFVQYELSGTSRLVQAEETPRLTDGTLAESLRKLANEIRPERGPGMPQE